MLVVASMIGSGVFTTTGFLVRDIRSLAAVLLVWIVSGLIALCGALAYAELAAALPHNGGEYRLLSRVYHPGIGFTAGWVSLIAGFSAPMAAAAVAFGEYFQNLFPLVAPKTAAFFLLALSAAIHAARVSWGAWVQNSVTIINVLLIVSFIVGSAWFADFSAVAAPLSEVVTSVTSPDFAIGLIYVSFAYSGWNAAIYVAGEMRDASKRLSRVLVGGTALTAILYTGLNLAFVAGAPAAELSGAVDVGSIAARHLFGPWAAQGASVLVSLGLLTTVSALSMTGPRVYEAMGRDYPRLAILSRRGLHSRQPQSKERGPVSAILLQLGAASVMVLTASYDTLLAYMGVILSAFSGMTVLGVLVLRKKEPHLSRPYLMWGYPWTVFLSLGLSMWMLGHALWQRPWASLAGIVTTLLGGIIYLWARPSLPPSQNRSSSPRMDPS